MSNSISGWVPWVAGVENIKSGSGQILRGSSTILFPLGLTCSATSLGFIVNKFPNPSGLWSFIPATLMFLITMSCFVSLNSFRPAFVVCHFSNLFNFLYNGASVCGLIHYGRNFSPDRGIIFHRWSGHVSHKLGALQGLRGCRYFHGFHVAVYCAPVPISSNINLHFTFYFILFTYYLNLNQEISTFWWAQALSYH